MAEWIGEIRFSAEVAAKLRQKHDLTPEQVFEAVAVGAHDSAGWDDDPSYGSRLVMFGSDEIGRIVVYLRPVDRRDGVWKCLTAWRV
jgi:hypothetical protein